ncbi:MAG TPA: hypothetical protein PK367_02210 [Candidatus Paceibacterota bacterium]|nr:hypothetical protein [Candidatus Paceibacterota bacterium]
MKNKSKKILFPFLNRYIFLIDYWWHRLFILIFFISVIIAFFVLLNFLNSLKTDIYADCLNFYTSSSRPIINLNDFCFRNNFPINFLSNVLLAFLFTTIYFYIAQIIYYKFFVHIILKIKNIKLKQYNMKLIKYIVILALVFIAYHFFDLGSWLSDNFETLFLIILLVIAGGIFDIAKEIENLSYKLYDIEEKLGVGEDDIDDF